MYNYAKRINFETAVVFPQFRLVELHRERETSLLNDKGQFFVDISEKTPYLRELVKQAQDLNLTVSGDGTAPVTGGDITQAGKGDIITIGSATRFDVNWAKRDQYVCQKGYRPVYDIVKDWTKIEKALKQFAAEKNISKYEKELKELNAKYHSRFMVVNGRVEMYPANRIAVAKPVERVSSYNDFETINLTIKVLRTF